MGTAASAAAPWTSVQLITLIVAALTPLTTLVGLFLVARSGRRQEQLQWSNQTVVTHRVEIFLKMAPGLNQLLCFATFVGNWKEIDPRKAVAVKRDLDQTMYAYRALFSDELFAAYHRFMAALFFVFGTNMGADAQIRAPIESKWGSRRVLPWWTDAMSALFSTDSAGPDDIQAAYGELYQEFRREMSVTLLNRSLLSDT